MTLRGDPRKGLLLSRNERAAPDGAAGRSTTWFHQRSKASGKSLLSSPESAYMGPAEVEVVPINSDRFSCAEARKP